MFCFREDILCRQHGPCQQANCPSNSCGLIKPTYGSSYRLGLLKGTLSNDCEYFLFPWNSVVNIWNRPRTICEFLSVTYVTISLLLKQIRNVCHIKEMTSQAIFDQGMRITLQYDLSTAFHHNGRAVGPHCHGGTVMEWVWAWCWVHTECDGRERDGREKATLGRRCLVGVAPKPASDWWSH